MVVLRSEPIPLLLASGVFEVGEYRQWQGLGSLIQVEREITSLEGETRIDKQYYISSLGRLSVNWTVYSRTSGD